jgi:hypothetical protein
MIRDLWQYLTWRPSAFLKHLLHRSCTRCRYEGWVAGYHAAAVASEARERLLRQGIDPEKLEQTIRERAA